jgi:hypothetical protein
LLRRLLLFVSAVAFSNASAHALPLYAGVPDNGTLPGQIWLIDPVAGNQLIGRPVTQGISGLALGSGGTLYATTSYSEPGGSSLLEIDPTTGALLSSVPITTPAGAATAVTDLAMQPGTNILYATTIIIPGVENQQLYTIDVATGVMTLVGDTGVQALGGGPIAFAPDGTLYYADWSSGPFFDELWLYRLDPLTGHRIGDRVASALGNGAMAVGPDGWIYGGPELCCGPVIWKGDPAVPGSAVPYALHPMNAIGDLVFVPEPAAGTLVGGGLALLAAAARRRRIRAPA